MIDPEMFQQFALSLPETTEEAHFHLRSFRVKKKIFATLNVPERRATFHFTLENQDVFATISKGILYPVPNKWGKYGWTNIDLAKAEWELCKDAIQVAWCDTAPAKLLSQHPELLD